jgi:hypothetical protein
MTSSSALEVHAKQIIEHLDNAEKLSKEADDYRLMAGRELIEARRLVKAGETSLSWSSWCAQYIKRRLATFGC